MSGLNVNDHSREVNRFYSRVNKLGPMPADPSLGSCWIWTGATRRGYGALEIKGKTMRAHRASWLFEHGTLPKASILHYCDNPLCVRPSHLWEGTQADNMHDMHNKGRDAKTYGEMQGNSKLSTADVIEIRRLARTGQLYHREIAAIKHVHPSVVTRIINKKAWAHLPDGS